eukprot:7150871-Prymnesium_polylepis.1
MIRPPGIWASTAHACRRQRMTPGSLAPDPCTVAGAMQVACSSFACVSRALPASAPALEVPWCPSSRGTPPDRLVRCPYPSFVVPQTAAASLACGLYRSAAGYLPVGVADVGPQLSGAPSWPTQAATPPPPSLSCGAPLPALHAPLRQAPPRPAPHAPDPHAAGAPALGPLPAAVIVSGRPRARQ